MLIESLIRPGVFIEELSTGYVFKIGFVSKYLITLTMLSTNKQIRVARVDFDPTAFKAVDVMGTNQSNY